MKNTPRNLSVRILNRVERGRAFAQPLLDSYLSKNIPASTQDRGLLTTLVYGTLRYRNRLDWVIRSVYNGNFDNMETGMLNILRVALYQILFTDRVPTYAATDEAVQMTKTMYPGRSNLVNALLRNAARKMNAIQYPLFDEDPLLHVSVAHSHPLWIVKMWAEQLGVEETHALCRSNNEIPPFTIRANRLKTTRPDLIGMLAECGCGASPSPYSPSGIELVNPPVPVNRMRLYEEGYFQIQDEASQLISLLLDPKPGEMVLDICAGAGVKTTHMAELMQNRGRIVAGDLHRNKIATSRIMARRLGSKIIEPMVHDATKDPRADLREMFDRVLVDAPCSGMGTLRRNPEIRWHSTPESLKAFPPLQKAILRHSASCVKKGGTMVYATCTISSDENEAVVREFLSTHPDFEYARPTAFAAGMLDTDGMFRTFPHRHGTDGFFGVAFQRKGE